MPEPAPPPADPAAPPADPAAPPADPVRAALADPCLHQRLRAAAAAALRGRLDPDEIVQKVCERALRKSSGYDPAKGSAAGWVYGFVANVCREELRRAGRLPKRHEHPEDFPATPAPDTDPEDRAAEAGRQIRDYLDRLPARAREVLDARYLQCQSFEQMIPRFGPTNAAVRKAVSRALTEMKAVANRCAAGATMGGRK